MHTQIDTGSLEKKGNEVSFRKTAHPVEMKMLSIRTEIGIRNCAIAWRAIKKSEGSRDWGTFGAGAVGDQGKDHRLRFEHS